MQTNVKKLFSLVLAFVLVLGLMPLQAFAAGTAWDGTTLTEPAKSGDVYQIGTGAELAWFAQKAAADSEAVLTADIDLDNKTWTSMAKFSGTFDGQGHTVKNLNGINGLFAEVAGASNDARAEVKNVTVEGTINATAANAAGIAGKAYNATFKNCINKANVTGTNNKTTMGGVVGHGMKSTTSASNLTLINCGNEGDITVSYSGPVGGVIGGRVIGNATLENCYNTGTITGVTTGNAGTPAGLISYCDSTKGSNYVKNCYNTGAIQGTTGYAGGLVGYVVGTDNKLENCFNAGSVTSTGKNPGAIAANINSKAALTATNCYYLSGSASRVVGNGSANISVISRTADQMKNLALDLGDSFVQGENYPVLAWQATKNEGYTVTLTADESEVEIGDIITVTATVTGGVFRGMQAVMTYDDTLFDLGTVSGIAQNSCENGKIDLYVPFIEAGYNEGAVVVTATFTAKKAGTAAFDFESATAGDYDDFMGDAVDAEVVPVEVTVAEKTYNVAIAGGITGGTVTVNSTAFAAGADVTLTVTPDDGYQLKSLTYTAEGGEPVAITGNSFTMPASNVTVNAEFELIPATTYTITVPEVENATVTVTVGSETYNEGVEIEGLTEGMEFTVTADPAEDFVISGIKVMSNGYELTATEGVYTVANGNITIEVTVAEKALEVTISEKDYVTGYKLVTVTGTYAAGYTYDGNAMIKIAKNTYAYLTADADAAKVAKNTNGVECGDITGATKHDVNGTGKVDFNDAGAAFGCYNKAYDVAQYMEMYLRADVDGDKKVEIDDVNAIMSSYSAKTN